MSGKYFIQNVIHFLPTNASFSSNQGSRNSTMNGKNGNIIVMANAELNCVCVCVRVCVGGWGWG